MLLCRPKKLGKLARPREPSWEVWICRPSFTIRVQLGPTKARKSYREPATLTRESIAYAPSKNRTLERSGEYPLVLSEVCSTRISSRLTRNTSDRRTGHTPDSSLRYFPPGAAVAYFHFSNFRLAQ